MIRACVFDLYNTLLRRGGLGATRELPRLLGVSGRDWVGFVREELMIRAFASSGELATFVRERLVPSEGPELDVRIIQVIADEHESVRPFPGVPTLLSFLKNRGFRLGLVSNLASSHKEPLASWGLEKHFDAIYLSCDEGRQKPDPEVFREICRRLDVAEEEALMVGDSLPNDILAAAKTGMRTLGVGRSSEGWVPATTDLGLLDVETLRPLLPRSHPVLGDEFQQRIRPVSDEEQGSYNMVYRVDPEEPGAPAYFVKRYALPESVAVEELAYRLQRETGLGQCEAFPIGEIEPLLAIEEASGEKWAGYVDPAIAYEVGRHMTFAYVFSNADARPRNAFVSGLPDSPRITMIDLEHCFFDLAIDTEGIENPFDPHVIDRVEDIESRIVRRVLSEKTTRRTRRTFVREEEHGEENLASFGRGWCDFYHHLQSRKDELVGILRERIHREPYLIIGTRKYRRAMAEVDVRLIEARLGENPEANFIRYQ